MSVSTLTETNANANADTDTAMPLFTTISSPLGELLLRGDGERLHGLHMQAGKRPLAIEPQWTEAPDAFASVTNQLEEYFAGERTAFEIEIELQGTPFQRTVWAALREIPYGETIDYGELARRVGNPAAARAVGLANGRNPVAVIVPCHRVIGADGTLTGFGGGLLNKRLLLDLEAARSRPRML
jgi:methylated-DNA-[protein]-cysteine S-methyltransferase